MDETAKRYNKVLEIINKRLIPDKDAKKARGEVFTPLNLIQEMLLGLRQSSLEKGVIEIWGINEDGEYVDDDDEDRVGGVPLATLRDSDTTWLDPANGIGNFPVVAFYILDFQLGHYGSEEFRGVSKMKQRRKHIIQKMLYMIELNKGNVNACIKIFKLIEPDVRANVCCANTLEMSHEKLKSVFGINQFDVIMGNPPFNEGGTAEKGRTIWNHFITKDSKTRYPFPGCLHLLKVHSDKKRNGVLAFVIPSSWRNGDEAWKTLKEHTFITIKMAVSDFPEINLPIDAWILQKEKSGDKTHILDKNNNYTIEAIGNFPYIPNFGISIFKKIWSKGENDLEVISQSKFDPTGTFGKKYIKKEKDSTHIYPIIKTITEEGADIYYSSIKDPVQDELKVVIGDYSYLYPHIDKQFAGVGRHAFYIPVNDLKRGIQMVKFLNSKLIQYLSFAIKISGASIQSSLMKSFPDPEILFTSDEEIYDHYNFSKKEKKLIEDYFLEKPIKLKGNIQDEPKLIKDLGNLKKSKSISKKVMKGGKTTRKRY